MADFTVVVAYVLAATLAAAGLIVMRFARRNMLNWVLAAMLLIRAGENLVEGINVSLHLDEALDATLFFVERSLEAALWATFALFAMLFAGKYWDERWGRWAWPATAVVLVVMLIGSAPGISLRLEESAVVALWPNLFAVPFYPVPMLSALLILVAGHRSGRETVRHASEWLSIGISLGLVTGALGAPGRLFWCEALGASACAELGAPALARAIGITTIMTLAIPFVLIVLARLGKRKWIIGAVAMMLAGAGLDAWSYVSEADIALRAYWFLLALAVLAFPLLLVYGMLRYQVLGMDLKFKRTIKGSTIAAVFIGVFVAATQVAGAWIEDVYGSSVIGALATLAMVAAIVPIRRFADKVAQKAVPEAKPVAAMDEDDRAEVYGEQLEFAWADGAIDLHERRRLEKLRVRLGLDAELATTLENRIVGA